MHRFKWINYILTVVFVKYPKKQTFPVLEITILIFPSLILPGLPWPYEPWRKEKVTQERWSEQNTEQLVLKNETDDKYGEKASKWWLMWNMMNYIKLSWGQGERWKQRERETNITNLSCVLMSMWKEWDWDETKRKETCHNRVGWKVSLSVLQCTSPDKKLNIN